MVVAQDIPRNTALRILEERLQLPGVAVEVAAVREYPAGEAASQVVGYLGPIPAEEAQRLTEEGYNPNYDRIGYAGVEFFLQDSWPACADTSSRVDVAGCRARHPALEAVAGRNVRLTLDYDLQTAAQEALTRRINIVNGEAGRIVTNRAVVIALDPRPGKSWRGELGDLR